MKRIRIYPYKMYCESAALLTSELRKRGLNALRVYPDGKYRLKKGDLVINWGCSSPPQWKNPLKFPFTLINKWENIPNAINKIHAFARFRATGVSCPEATVSTNTALSWYNDGKTVIGRKTLIGRGGQGIVVMTKPEKSFEECPLYTEYKPKRKEFRLHVFDGKVIDVQEKRKKKNAENINTKIRSHGNGWVFCRQNVILPEDAMEQSIKAVASLGLLFGGVDLIWNETENKSYVLEVNSAPGIEGTTVMKYADEIQRLSLLT